MDRKPLLIVMVGLPGSGKSTKAEELKEKYGFKVFSSDKIRGELYGDENCQVNHGRVFGTLYGRMNRALQNGENCILDATNANRKDRKGAFRQVQDVGNYDVVAYVVTTNVEECIKRDSGRDRTVGPDVVKRYADKFTMPSSDEGFKDVFIDNSSYDMKRFHNLLEGNEAQIENPEEDLCLL